MVATANGRDADWVKELGAEQGIDYTTTRVEDAVDGVDMVFDTVGGGTPKRACAQIGSATGRERG